MFNKNKIKHFCDYKELMPSEATFSGFTDRVELEQHFQKIVKGYDFLVAVGAITKYQRCELVDKLSEEFEKRICFLFREGS